MSANPWYRKPGWIILLLVIFPPVGIFLTWRHGPWQRNTKIVVTVASCLFFVFASTQDKRPTTTTAEDRRADSKAIQVHAKPTSAEKPALPQQGKDLTKMYRIIFEKDLSMKAISGPLSSYSIAEIKALPTNVRREYRIVVPSTISRYDLQESMKHLVITETKANPDIDEIVVFAYDREEDSNGAFTFGKMEWCPEGRWDGVTPEIAAKNDRSSYRFVFDIRDKVGHVTDDLKPTAREYEMYDALDKALWAHPNENENAIKKGVAKKLGVSVEKLDKAYIKVVNYNLK